MSTSTHVSKLEQVILRRRITAPSPGHVYVPRPRLDQLLDRDVPVTLLVAPAGFGKTTALAGWQQHASQPVAWLGAQQEDGDLTSFVELVLASISECQPGFGEMTRAHCQSEQWTPSSLAQILRDDLENLSQKTVLVVDDFHAIQSADVTALVSELLREPLTMMRIVISTRWVPDISLSRLRVQGFVQDIRAADLRFDKEESRALLTSFIGVEPEQDDVDRLFHRTEGWAAALRLLGFPLRHSRNGTLVPEHLQQDSERHLMDFLLEEVLSPQPEIVRHLLVRTSILDRVCGSLADVLVDIPHAEGSSERILASLAAAGILAERRENDCNWYQAPELLRDLLKLQLNRELHHDDILALARQAGDWLSAHRHIGDAIDLALQADEYERVADVIEGSRVELLEREAWQDLAGWLRRLPENVVQRRPLLQAMRLRTSMVGGNVTSYCRDYHQIMKRIGDPDESNNAETLDALTFETDLYDAYMGSVSGSDRERIARVADDLISDTSRGDASGRGLALMAWAEVNLRPGNEEVVLRRLSDSLVDESDAGRVYQSRVLIAQAMVYQRLGHMNLYAQTGRHLEQLADQHQLELLAAWGSFIAGHAAYERDDLDGAESCFRRVLSTPQPVHYRTMRDALIGLILIANARRDVANVEGMLSKLDQAILQDGHGCGLELAQSLRVRLHLINGEASGFGNTGIVSSIGMSDQSLFEIPQLTHAKQLLRRQESGDIECAFSILGDLESWASGRNDRRSIVEILLTRAIAHQLAGDEQSAVSDTLKATALVGEEPIERTVLDFGLDLRPLLALMSVEQLGSPGLLRVSHVLGCSPRRAGSCAGSGVQHKQVRGNDGVYVYEVLTERETDVLRLLGKHLSNQEIGERLFVSPLTVKRHASNIYGKLGVGSRRQAIVRAAELGYLHMD